MRSYDARSHRGWGPVDPFRGDGRLNMCFGSLTRVQSAKHTLLGPEGLEGALHCLRQFSRGPSLRLYRLVHQDGLG